MSTQAFDPRTVEFLQTVRGKTLTVFCAILTAHRPVTALEIAHSMVMSRNTVTTHLWALEAIGYAACLGAGRWPRWTLTSKARQLPLPGLLQAPPTMSPTRQIEDESDAQKLCITPGSSSSSFPMEERTDVHVIEPLLPPPDAQKKRASPPGSPEGGPDPALTELLDRLLPYAAGCSSALLRQAAQAAIDRDENPDYTVYSFLSWALYAESPLGDGIHSPPAHFAARKIQRDEECPYFKHRIQEYGEDARRWIQWRNVNERWLRDRASLELTLGFGDGLI